jgi:hypothetical protein
MAGSPSSRALILVSRPQLHNPAPAAGGLVAAVQHVGDLVDLLGAWGGIPGGGPQVNVAEPGRDGVHRHAGLETVRSPVGTQRMRVAEPLRHASGRAAAPHDSMHGDGGQGERLFMSVAPQPDEQGLLVQQPDAAGEHYEREDRSVPIRTSE